VGKRGFEKPGPSTDEMAGTDTGSRFIDESRRQKYQRPTLQQLGE